MPSAGLWTMVCMPRQAARGEPLPQASVAPNRASAQRSAALGADRSDRLRDDGCTMTALDEIDCALLATLQERGDAPNLELARAVGLSPAATSRRVQRLRADGVVEAVRAVVAPEQVGLGVEAYVLITLAE